MIKPDDRKDQAQRYAPERTQPEPRASLSVVWHPYARYKVNNGPVEYTNTSY